MSLPSRFVLPFAFALLTVAGTAAAASDPPIALADPSAPDPYAAPADADFVEPVAAHRDWHHGFYLRAGVGAGGLSDSFRSEAQAGAAHAQAYGPSGSFELAAGGSLRPGLVLGGGVYVESVRNPKVSIDGIEGSSNLDSSTLVLVGPFVDWYLRPDGGFHLQGSLGGARMALRDGAGHLEDPAPVGAGAVFGVGYEWRVANGWGIGVLGRLLAASLSDGEVRHDVGGASVMFSATYN